MRVWSSSGGDIGLGYREDAAEVEIRTGGKKLCQEQLDKIGKLFDLLVRGGVRVGGASSYVQDR